MKKILVLLLIIAFGCKEDVSSTALFEGEFNAVGTGMSNQNGKDTFTVLRVNKDNISVYNKINTVTLKAKRSYGDTYKVYDGSGKWYDFNVGKNINVYYEHKKATQ